MGSVASPFGQSGLLIISCDERIGNALCRYFRVRIGPGFPVHFPQDRDGHPKNLVIPRCAEDIHRRLDYLGPAELRNLCVVVDLVSDAGSSWSTTYQGRIRPMELVLRYPEVYWIFLDLHAPEYIQKEIGNSENGKSPAAERCRRYHFPACHDLESVSNLINRHCNGFRSWFDCGGLRDRTRDKVLAEENKSSDSNHSAPQWLQSLSSSLLRRSRVISTDAKSPLVAVHAAVLALEAHQILSGRSRTLALEALALIEKSEMIAECAFVGLSSSLPIKERVEELDKVLDDLFSPPAIEIIADSPSHKVDKVAAVIEEEALFAAINGYYLYRRGYHAFLILTDAEMIEILGSTSTDESRKKIEGEVEISCVAEDIDLRFADRKSNKYTDNSALAKERETITKAAGCVRLDGELLSEQITLLARLRRRAKIHPGLQGSRPGRNGKLLRIFVSQVAMKDLRWSSKSCLWLCRLFSKEKRAQWQELLSYPETQSHVAFFSVTKPYGGFLEESWGLNDSVLENKPSCRLVRKKGQPCIRPKFCPVLVRLIIFTFCGSRCEATAEWYTRMSARTEILDDIQDVLIDFDQVKERDNNLVALRESDLLLTACASIGGRNRAPATLDDRPLALIRYLFSAYCNCLVSSLGFTLMWIAIWITLFGFLKYLPLLFFCNMQNVIDVRLACHSVTDSLFTFFSLQPQYANITGNSFANSAQGYCRIFYWFFTLAEVICGWFHLGLLVSYLYQKVSRR